MRAARARRLLLALARSGGGSAFTHVDRLAGRRSWCDAARYWGRDLPFCGRAQLAAADLHEAGIAPAGDIEQLTACTGLAVAQLLRRDGVLWFDPPLEQRIEQRLPIAPGAPAEVALRACAVHAVELIVAARGDGACPVSVEAALAAAALAARPPILLPHTRSCAY